MGADVKAKRRPLKGQELSDAEKEAAVRLGWKVSWTFASAVYGVTPNAVVYWARVYLPKLAETRS